MNGLEQYEIDKATMDRPTDLLTETLKSTTNILFDRIQTLAHKSDNTMGDKSSDPSKDVGQRCYSSWNDSCQNELVLFEPTKPVRPYRFKC